MVFKAQSPLDALEPLTDSLLLWMSSSAHPSLFIRHTPEPGIHV